MLFQDLLNDLKSELSANFEDALIALLMKSEEYDAYEIKRAIRVCYGVIALDTSQWFTAVLFVSGFN